MSIRYDRSVSESARNLAENVRRIRLQRGWTQQQLGQKIGDWPQERVSELESGRFDKKLSFVDLIAKALKVQTPELLSEQR